MYKRIIYTIGLSLSLIMSFMICPIHGEGNLLSNSSFEEVRDNLPSNWKSSAYKNSDSDVKFSLEEGQFKDGSKSFSITNINENDSKLSQDITLEAGKVYNFSCWVKTENIKNQPGSANITVENELAIYTSKELKDTNNDWQLLEFNLKIPENVGNAFKFALRLGGQGTVNQGKAYFDQAKVELAENQSESNLGNFLIKGSTKKDSTNNVDSGYKSEEVKSSGSTNKTVFFIILAVLIVGLLVFVEMKLKKKSSDSIDDQSKNLDDKDEE